jgi:hypothetical protein
MRQIFMVLVTAAVTLMTGCAVVKVSPQGRVASDQLLISIATEDTVAALQIKDLVEGKAIRLTVTSLGTVQQDLSYVTEALRARILQEGGRVTPDDKQAIDLVAMIQTIGSDIDRTSIALPVPLPALGSVAITKLSFYTDSKQVARCRMWLYAIDAEGKLIFTHPPIHTAHRIRNPVLFGFTLGKFSDVKELDHSKGSVPVTEPGLTE